MSRKVSFVGGSSGLVAVNQGMLVFMDISISKLHSVFVTVAIISHHFVAISMQTSFRDRGILLLFFSVFLPATARATARPAGKGHEHVHFTDNSTKTS